MCACVCELGPWCFSLHPNYTISVQAHIETGRLVSKHLATIYPVMADSTQQEPLYTASLTDVRFCLTHTQNSHHSKHPVTAYRPGWAIDFYTHLSRTVTVTTDAGRSTAGLATIRGRQTSVWELSFSGYVSFCSASFVEKKHTLITCPIYS